MSKLLPSALPLALLIAACGEEEATETGTITVRAYGEAFIEEGIPASDVDDGWAIQFERFLVSVNSIVVAGEDVADPDLVDLAKASDGMGQVLGSTIATAGDHGAASFSVARVQVEGSAEKGSTTKTFAWTFDSLTHYSHCDTVTKLKADGKATFQITIHADHLFYDSLVSEAPQLLFGPIAEADADDDGEVTEAELAQADIGSYDPGNDDELDDLWSFLIAQHRTLGHVDGEGHCEASVAD